MRTFVFVKKKIRSFDQIKNINRNKIEFLEESFREKKTFLKEISAFSRYINYNTSEPGPIFSYHIYKQHMYTHPVNERNTNKTCVENY